MIQSSGILFQIIWRFLTIFAETSSNGIFEFLKITNFDFTEKRKINDWFQGVGNL